MYLVCDVQLMMYVVGLFSLTHHLIEYEVST